MFSSPRMAQATIKRILVPTDFSAAADKAIPYALQVAVAYNSTLYLLHVLPREESARESLGKEIYMNRRVAERQFRILENSRRLSRVSHSYLMEPGDICGAVCDAIRRHQIQLVVMGTRGRGGVAKLLMGSSAEEIVRSAVCPVLLVGPAVPPLTEVPELAHVLYATDYSEASQAALSYAILFSENYSARLTFIHVVAASEDLHASDAEGMQAEAEDRLKALVGSVFQHILTPRLVARFGDPGKVITKTAAEEGTDLIVMGVHRAASMAVSTHLPWTTSHYVVCHAHCPVLLVTRIN